MKKATFTVERSAKRSFGRGASQAFSKLRRGRNFHRPSAPGQPPNVDFGILKSSVTSVIETGRDIEGFVGSDIDHIKDRLRGKKGTISNLRSTVQYGFFLEVGTKFMAARPWLRPALRKNSAKILRIFQKANS